MHESERQMILNVCSVRSYNRAVITAAFQPPHSSVIQGRVVKADDVAFVVRFTILDRFVAQRASRL